MKTITLFSILLLLGNTLSAQNDEFIKNLCSGKWHKSYWLDEYGQRQLYSMQVSKKSWKVFYPNGKVRIGAGKNEYFGEWEFDPESNILLIKDRGTIIRSKIVRLTKSDFVYTIRIQNWENEYGYKKLNIKSKR